MTITRIKYEKLFPVGAYLNEKIGFEADVSGTQEDIISYLDQLRDLAERSHKEKYPHLYNDNQPEGKQHIADHVFPSNEPKDTISIAIEEMNKCTAISQKNRLGVEEGLLFYANKFLDNEKFRMAYELKMEKLRK